MCADLGISKSALQVWVRDAQLRGRGIEPASSVDVDAKREQAKMLESHWVAFLVVFEGGGCRLE